MDTRTVSLSLLVVWALWALAVAITLVGGAVVLVWGEHIWARAVGLALFGAEMLVVAAAAVLTARLLLHRHDRRIGQRLDLQDDVRSRIAKLH